MTLHLPEWAIRAWEIAQPWAQPVLIGAGAVAALLAALLIWRFLRTGQTHARLGTVAVTVATLFAMEGMFEVARGPLGLNAAGSLMFCATFELVMLHQGALAAHKLAANPRADVRRHMTFIWLVAAASGLIASTASGSITEVVLRLVTPPLAAGIWYMSLYADRQPAERQPTRWIWTPERLGVRWGLLKPGAVDDLAEVFRQRAVTALVDVAVVVWTEQQAAKLAGSTEPSKALAKASRKLQQLAKTADQQTVAAARAQLRLTLDIQTELFRRDDRADDATRATLDEVRLVMRQATERLRAQHEVAFRSTVPDETWSNPMVRMPRHVAERIGVDQVTQPGEATDAPAQPAVTHPDAPTDDADDARPISAPPDSRTDAERAAAIAEAVRRVTVDGAAKRQAAREAGVSEATVRRAVDKAKATGDAPDAPTRVNGEQPALI